MHKNINKLELHAVLIERYLRIDPQMVGKLEIRGSRKSYRILVIRPYYCEKLKWTPVVLLDAGFETESDAMEIVAILNAMSDIGSVAV
jgi:hypothetical protein